MSAKNTGAALMAPSTAANVGIPAADSWGTATLFMRLARVSLATASYWLCTVYRPAHRISHPFLSVNDCPGCAYEKAAR